jgi:3D (Asp-Asp-Asp) domain-containing protein
LLEIGTKIRIPEIFGEKIFIVKDRMNKKKGKYQIDVWFEDQKKALEFGVKKTYIEILE